MTFVTINTIVMKTPFILLFCIISITSKSQTCDTGMLDARVKAGLLKIGDLQPKLDTISIEQAKQDELAPDALFPAADVTLAKITQDSLPLYIFNATGKKNLPVILYFHPGGFVTPFLPFMKYDCWKMSKDLEAIVIGVDYRIAPAHKFPAAVNDAYAALQWILNNAERYDGNIDQLAVAGLSAGANLAAVVSQRAKKNGLGTKIKLQILNCPSVDNIHHQANYPSYRRYAKGYFQTREFIVFAQNTYADERDFDNPEFAPILAESFRDLPSTVLFTAEFDILRDEEMAYMNKLRSAGVKVWHHCFAGQIHCLVGLPPEADEFKIMNGIIKRAMADAWKD
jgi:acetyl esterase